VTTSVLATALLAGCSLLAGCGSGPNQFGSAAIVGSQSVSLAELQRQVDSVLAKPQVMQSVSLQGGQPADISQVMVTNDVQHLLLTEAARRDNVVINDKQVDAILAQQGGAEAIAAQSIFDPAGVRQAVRDQLTSEALAIKNVDRLSVTVDSVRTGSRAEALAVAQQLAAGPAKAEAALRVAGPNGQLNQQMRAWQPDAIAYLGTLPGQVVAAQTAQSTWTVWRVTRRDMDAAAAPGAASQLDDQTLNRIGRRLLQPVASELGVRVNPRYGEWDLVQVSVLPKTVEPSIVLAAAPNPAPSV
jgi:hypothetical protein